MKIENPRPDDNKFSWYWNLLSKEIESRENLSSSHLLQLKVLCDAHVQYDDLLEQVREEGFSIAKITKSAETIVANPLLVQLNRTVGHIRDYSKMLGLVIVKTEIPTEEPESDEEDVW